MSLVSVSEKVCNSANRTSSFPEPCAFDLYQMVRNTRPNLCAQILVAQNLFTRFSLQMQPPRYVCPPWFECDCPPGVPRSLSTMKLHRPVANMVRTSLSRGWFKRGPKLSDPNVTRYRFQCQDSLLEHDSEETIRFSSPYSADYHTHALRDIEM